MSISDFFTLLGVVAREPIFSGSVEVLKIELLKHGYSYKTGVQTACYYYQEMEKAVKYGKEGTYFQRFKTVIVGDDYNYFCEDGLGFGAQIKIGKVGFAKFGEVLKESMGQPHQTEHGNELNLFKNIEESVAEDLFNVLKTYGYIIESTNHDVFIELFVKGKVPDASDKIVWIKNKQSLRELLKKIKREGVKMAEVERSVKLIFLDGIKRDKKPIEMHLPSSHLKDQDTDSHFIIKLPLL